LKACQNKKILPNTRDCKSDATVSPLRQWKQIKISELILYYSQLALPLDPKTIWY